MENFNFFQQKSNNSNKTLAFKPSFIGFIGGMVNYSRWFEPPVPSARNILVFVCVVLVAYVIIKYRLMDIRIAVTRAGIFVFVYSLVLGAPFGLAVFGRQWLLGVLGEGWFWAPMLVLLVLATAGPFIYLFIQNRAEDRLLREQRRYQATLRKASLGMGRIKSLKRLLKLIVHVIIRAVRIEHCKIYLFDEKSGQYVLGASRNGVQGKKAIGEFACNSNFIKFLKKIKQPVVYDETKQSIQDYQDKEFCEIKDVLNNLDAAVVIPSFSEKQMIAFIVFGKKRNGRLYSHDDLVVFSILANQAALAIENAEFYERDKENNALLYQSATLADMGVMADSMGHQIKNHIQKMMCIAGVEAGMLKEILSGNISYENAMGILNRLVGIFVKIEQQGKKGGEVIESISKFSRLPQSSFQELNLREILKIANDILQFKIKFRKFDYRIDISEDVPLLYAHPILSEAFVNLIDNAYDAIKEKESEYNQLAGQSCCPGDYRGVISFSACLNDPDNIKIKIADNGIGIEKIKVKNIFLPFYTTKASSAKGTGLGLFVLKKIIDNHGGSIAVESQRMRGTIFTITLPVRAKV